MKAFIYIIISALLLLACSNSKKDEHASHTAAIQYTCPMHPSVVKDSPGKCPICGMDLVPKKSGDNNNIMLTASQTRLANITTQKVTSQSIEQTVTINARLTTDQNYSEVISTRVAGRVEKLFFKETGKFIKKGEPLYEFYSEILLTLQKEYLIAKDQYETFGKADGHYESLLKSAEKKLLLYGLSKNQVEQLAQSKSVQPRITFLAPASGVILEINASEGQYQPEGGVLYKIENINHLWLEAELYPQENSLVKIGDKINVLINGYESSPLETKVTYLSPEYRANTQIMVMRASIDNTEMKFKAGEQAQVLFNHSAKRTMTVPIDAVIHDGKGTHVYIESDSNTFQPRIVKTGIESSDQVEIIDGLKENEIIVVTGAYLLYSEFILKKGLSPVAEHHHEAMNSREKENEKTIHQQEETSDAKQAPDVDPQFSAQLATLLLPYLKMKDALVTSNTKASSLESRNFSTMLKKIDMNLLKGKAHIDWMEKLTIMEQASSSIQNENDLEKQRALFSDLTNALYSTFKMYSVKDLHAYYQYCPMAFHNKGAFWISREREISNPYFGEQMLHCGETKETLK